MEGSEEVEVEDDDDGLEIDGSLLELHSQPIVPNSEGCELILEVVLEIPKFERRKKKRVRPP